MNVDDTDYGSPDADMTDAEIKQATYARIESGEDDWPEPWED